MDYPLCKNVPNEYYRRCKQRRKHNKINFFAQINMHKLEKIQWQPRVLRCNYKARPNY